MKGTSDRAARKLPVQKLTKSHVDKLVSDLVVGGAMTAKGRTRRPSSTGTRAVQALRLER
ncbi:MAG: hypothetical protein ACRDUX_41700 [Mycobacterium sp.]